MTIKMLRQLSENDIQALTTHLDSLTPWLEDDVSNYAKGRKRFWLQHEWDLRNRTFSPALKDERLWTFCKRMMPSADLGLAVYGPVGISLHRDDSYADYRSVGINLGEVDGWVYDCQYPEFRWTRNTNPTNTRNLKLPVGAVFEFNCKNPHAVINPATDRWAIFLWDVGHKFRQAFNAYKEVSND